MSNVKGFSVKQAFQFQVVAAQCACVCERSLLVTRCDAGLDGTPSSLLQLLTVLENILSKLARYDEGSFFSSILSLTVSLRAAPDTRIRFSHICKFYQCSLFISIAFMPFYIFHVCKAFASIKQ